MYYTRCHMYYMGFTFTDGTRAASEAPACEAEEIVVMKASEPGEVEACEAEAVQQACRALEASATTRAAAAACTTAKPG